MSVYVISNHCLPAHGGPFQVLSDQMRLLHRPVRPVAVMVCKPPDIPGCAARAADWGGGARIFPSWHYGISWSLTWWLLRSIGPNDVLLVHMLWDYSSLLPAVIAWMRGAGLVLIPHGSVIEESRRAGLLKAAVLALYGGLLRRTRNRVIALTERESDEIKRCGLSPDPVIIPNGVDCSGYLGFPPPPRTGPKEGAVRRRLLYLGRIAEEKNLGMLIEAVALVQDQLRTLGVLLELVGPDHGGYQSVLEARIRDLHLRDLVVFRGAQYGANKVDYIQACDCLVSPSNREALSISVLEGLACGRPVAINASVSDAFQGHEEGMWVVGDRVEEWAQWLVQVGERESGELEQRGRMALEYARASFSIHRAIGCYEDALEALTLPSRPAAA